MKAPPFDLYVFARCYNGIRATELKRKTASCASLGMNVVPPAGVPCAAIATSLKGGTAVQSLVAWKATGIS